MRAAAAAALAVLPWAPPRAGARDVTVTFRCAGAATPAPSPSPDCTPADGQVVRGTWKVAFRAKAGEIGRIRRIKLFIVSQEPGILSPGQQRPEDPVPPVDVWGDGPAPSRPDWSSITSAPNEYTVVWDWDTAALTPSNGLYKVRVEAWSHTDGANDPSVAERKDIKVDNPPAKPGRPRVLAATIEGVRVEWDPAPEPDVRSYVLWRARTASADARPDPDAFEKAKVVGADRTTVFDPVTTPGAYWYRVQVVRRSVVDPEDGIASPLSDPTERPGVVVPPPPTPEPVVVATPPPRVTGPPKLPKVVLKPPPVPDAPFSAVLPYDDAEVGPPEAEMPEGAEQLLAQSRSPERDTSERAAVLPVAVGLFLVSAALSLGRLGAGVG